MKAIIIAAGSGKRISNDVKELPKSLVLVNGKPIIEYQLAVLKENNIHEIIIITGPYSEKFYLTNVTYVKDHKYSEHDILGSLMEAKKYLNDEVLILYSDIIFESTIIKQIIKNKDEIAIAIDVDWEEMYNKRSEHPKSEAENVLLNDNNEIIKIKKNIQNKNGEIAEFLGIIKLSKSGSKIFTDKFEESETKYNGNFHEAESISKAYLTDMIQELIDSKIVVKPIKIIGKWCEIDTLQDLEKAEKLCKNYFL